MSYTWEKLLGYGSDSNLFSSTSYRAPLVPGFGMKGEYGNLSFESQNVLHAGGTWQIPFGSGRRFWNHRGLLDVVAGGWNLNGILTYQSGQPVTIGCVTSHSASSGCYANLVRGRRGDLKDVSRHTLLISEPNLKNQAAALLGNLTNRGFMIVEQGYFLNCHTSKVDLVSTKSTF